jgi:hypothetical protein
MQGIQRCAVSSFGSTLLSATFQPGFGPRDRGRRFEIQRIDVPRFVIGMNTVQPPCCKCNCSTERPTAGLADMWASHSGVVADSHRPGSATPRFGKTAMSWR